MLDSRQARLFYSLTTLTGLKHVVSHLPTVLVRASGTGRKANHRAADKFLIAVLFINSMKGEGEGEILVFDTCITNSAFANNTIYWNYFSFHHKPQNDPTIPSLWSISIDLCVYPNKITVWILHIPPPSLLDISVP